MCVECIIIMILLVLNEEKQFFRLYVPIPVCSASSPEVPLIGGCEQVKFFYQDGNFDSSYVLKDIDSQVMDEGCVDGCIYLK